ncbi:DNA protecting protein DprA [Mangrovactinospora gilvigrisea]|uniref:DNA protecting protein DprA n=1 Tax=Mangrovactinospora gilvigrisea TaxID=1428644 RepID=A0A1J7BIT7_9ACTN|nr:DNA protecting protein DprA [Mangrovactinospora gilvigrisea]
MGWVAEPGDAVVGHWLAELGPQELIARLAGPEPLPRMGRERHARIRAALPSLDPAAELARGRAHGARFVCPGDAEWPTQLDDLGELRPYGLWVRGAPSLRLWALRSVSVVGSRACTSYGAHTAGELGAELAERGWTVVSGAAYGIDAAVHRGALAVAGPTVAVLACGVDRAYPPRNTALLRRIAEDGLVVAELPPGTAPNRSRFVLRNRVIAALTRGTVVVEAGLRSGALITARRARDLGRQLMAVPGPVTSPLSEGAHQLLRAGGVLVTSAAEVAEQIGAIGADLAPPLAAPALPRDLLDAEAAAVLEAVPARPGAPLEAVAAEARRDPERVLRRLHELVALGFAAREGRLWRAVPPTGPVPGRG